MEDRREFLGALGAGLLFAALPARAAPKEEDVAPAEDLMREHGVLRRVMFLYDDAAQRLESGANAPLDALASAAGIVRKVIEDYHEKLEETFVFPRLTKAKKLTGLTATLRRQHEAGRTVTAGIVKLCHGGDAKDLARLLRSFNRMYRPHAAREDTVLFPAFHDLLGEKAYRELGEQFEDEEKKKLGNEGFEGAVAQIAKLEEQFGLADLDQFTPR
ncbi:MAG: hemerythrin domain-containing protein [Myxococcales bacterium]